MPGVKLNNGKLAQRVVKVIEGMVIQALEETRGNQIQAAEICGLEYRSFRHLIDKHGIDAKGIRRKWRR